MYTSKFTIVFLLLFSFGVTAQDDQPFNMSLGLSFPTGKFGDNDLDSDRSGLAGLGVSAGIEKLFPLSKTGLFLYGGATLLINPYSRSAKDEIEDAIDDNDIDIRFPIYVQAPIQAGLEYQFEATDEMKIFIKGGLNLDLMKITNTKLSDGDGDVKIKYKPSAGIGGQIGLGLVLENGIKIGFNYMPLGQHRLKATTYFDGDSVDSETQKIRVTLVNAYVSIPFPSK